MHRTIKTNIMDNVYQTYFWIVKVINSVRTHKQYETAYKLTQTFENGFPKEKELHKMLNISLQKSYYNTIA